MNEVKLPALVDSLLHGGAENAGQEKAVQQHRMNNNLQQYGKLKGSRRAILAINPLAGRYMPRPTLRKRLCQLCNRFLEP